jgi:hypothetical protein
MNFALLGPPSGTGPYATLLCSVFEVKNDARVYPRLFLWNRFRSWLRFLFTDGFSQWFHNAKIDFH